MSIPKVGETLTHQLQLQNMETAPPTPEQALAQAKELGLEPVKPQLKTQQAPKPPRKEKKTAVLPAPPAPTPPMHDGSFTVSLNVQKPQGNGDKNSNRENTSPMDSNYFNRSNEESSVMNQNQAQTAQTAPSNGQAPAVATQPVPPPAGGPEAMLANLQYQGLAAFNRMANNLANGQPIYVAPAPAPSRFDAVRVGEKLVTATGYAAIGVGVFAGCYGIAKWVGPIS